MAGIWKTPGLQERHRELFDKHMSHSAIARVLSKEFGISISRNASIGRAYRQDYPARAVKGQGTSRGGRKNAAPRFNPERKPVRPKKVKEPEPMALGIPMVEVRRKRRMNGRYYKVVTYPLNNGTCRWPVEGTGADTRYCGHPPEEGSSYCTHHRERSVTMATPKAKDNFTRYAGWLSKRIITAGA